MTRTAIEVEDLSKSYRLGATVDVNRTFREILYQTVGRWGRRGGQQVTEPFWALRGVSFKVDEGQIVGVIGANGAGKSTLLKILSSITEPGDGVARIRGRVGSLLEVGTGFHPELTGRENIYLNGAILGMNRQEIRARFDEIVAFAGVEQFLDTAVKRYSSGMYVRLAFAVAAHLEPEVLIVDEVLAVGDAAFQQKCLGKMSDVAQSGRTVLFVSHNMAAVRSLCQRAVLLERGQLIADGPTADVVTKYLQTAMDPETIPVAERQDRQGDGSARITGVTIEPADDEPAICSGSRLRVSIDFTHEGPLRSGRFLVGVYDYSNAGIYLLDSDAMGDLPETLPHQGRLTCVTDPINVTPGRCYVNVALKKAGAIADYVQHAASFEVHAGDGFGLRHTPSRNWVLCLLRQQWRLGERAAA